MVELLLGAALLPAQLRPREARAKQQALLLTMNAAALPQGRVGQAEAQGSVDHRPVPTVEDQSETWGSHRRGFGLTGPGMGTALRWYERRAGVH